MEKALNKMKISQLAPFAFYIFLVLTATTIDIVATSRAMDQENIRYFCTNEHAVGTLVLVGV
jgi:hypothetical protein